MSSVVERAQAYVAASNAHDIAAIRPMLAAGCSYCSAAVGRYVGPDAIIAMMEGFFAENPDAHWDVPEYSSKGGDMVEFAFTITLLGQHFEGTERLYYDGSGLICRIEVER